MCAGGLRIRCWEAGIIKNNKIGDVGDAEEMEQ